MMPKYAIKIVLSVLTLALIGGGAGENVDLEINPQVPSNQVHAGEGYFDLIMGSGSSQQIVVYLTNTAGKTITVNVGAAPATTDMNGLVEYTPTVYPLDPSLKYNFKGLVAYQNVVTIPAKSSVKYTATVSMPKETFSGIIAGGLTFEEKDTTKQSNKKSGVAIASEYRYSVAVLMRQKVDPPAPNLSLHQIKAAQVSSRNIISANLQNSAMYYLNQMNTSATVTGISNTSLQYHFDNAQMQMAPNTNFNLPIPVSTMGALNGKNYSNPLEAGKYHLHMVVYGQQNASGPFHAKVSGKSVNYQYRWIFDKDFTITATAAKKLNATDVTLRPANWSWLYWLIGSLLILIALLLIAWLIWKRRHVYNENVYDVEGAPLFSKGEQIRRKVKTYRLEDLSQAVQEKVKARLQLQAAENQNSGEHPEK